MRGFPKVIATGQDLYNCLAMVQAGTLDAQNLRQAVESIEARGFINCPVLEVSTDRKKVTINFCSEAKAGLMVNDVEVATVQHVRNATRTGSSDTSGNSYTDTVMTLKTPIAAGTAVLYIPSPVDPVAVIGLTAEQFIAIKEDLNKYE